MCAIRQYVATLHSDKYAFWRETKGHTIHIKMAHSRQRYQYTYPILQGQTQSMSACALQAVPTSWLVFCIASCCLLHRIPCTPRTSPVAKSSLRVARSDCFSHAKIGGFVGFVHGIQVGSLDPSPPYGSEPEGSLLRLEALTSGTVVVAESSRARIVISSSSASRSAPKASRVSTSANAAESGSSTSISCRCDDDLRDERRELCCPLPLKADEYAVAPVSAPSVEPLTASFESPTMAPYSDSARE